MKNADMPAMPSGKLCFIDENGWGKELDSNGLTKRETMAMHMMQGIISRGNSALSSKGIARDAVVMADALLAELEKQQ